MWHGTLHYSLHISGTILVVRHINYISTDLITRGIRWGMGTGSKWLMLHLMLAVKGVLAFCPTAPLTVGRKSEPLSK